MTSKTKAQKESNKLKKNKTSFEANHIPSLNAGAPKKEIDIKLVEELCKISCTREEICKVLKVDDETLSSRLKEQGYANFSTFFEEKSFESTVSLRRKKGRIREVQLDVALEEKSVPMLIWVGKQYLGQKDNPDDALIKINKAKAGQSRVETVAEALEQKESLTHKQMLDELKTLSSIKIAERISKEELSPEEKLTFIKKLDKFLEQN